MLVLGFVPALIFAWAFEITPEGIKLESEIQPNKSITRKSGRKIVAITTVLAVMAAGLFVYQLLGPRPQSAVQGEAHGIPVHQGLACYRDGIGFRKNSSRTNLFAGQVQPVARVLQVVSGQVEIRLVTQSLFTSCNCFLIAIEFIIGGADIVPSFGVIWANFESSSAGCDAFSVAPFVVKLKTALEIKLRRFVWCLIVHRRVRFRHQFVGKVVGRT